MRYDFQKGDKFDYLTINHRAPSRPEDKTRGVRWVCKCKCGNTTTVFASNLVKGFTTSCGCKRKENFVKQMALGRERAGARTRSREPKQIVEHRVAEARRWENLRIAIIELSYAFGYIAPEKIEGARLVHGIITRE